MDDGVRILDAHDKISTYRLTRYREAHPIEAAAYHEAHERAREALDYVQRAAASSDFHEAHRWATRAAAMLPHTMANWAVHRESYARFCEREGFPIAAMLGPQDRRGTDEEGPKWCLGVLGQQHEWFDAFSSPEKSMQKCRRPGCRAQRTTHKRKATRER